jgi:type VI secretion system secreted protein Hcp
MAIDTHIKFDGIEGESTARDHKGEISVLSWNWGLTSPTSGTGTGAGRGKAKAEEFRFVHLYDKASPVLAKHAITAKAIKLVSLSARKSGNGQKDFFKVTMKDVFVTSVHDSTGADGQPAEEVSLAYGNIDFSYQPQDAKGSLGTAVTLNWNIRTGSAS